MPLDGMESSAPPSGHVGNGGKRQREGDPDEEGRVGTGGGSSPPTSQDSPMLGLGDGKDAGRKRILPRMSVGSFYGSGLTGALLKIRERSLKQSRASVAKEFGKQQLAYDFCDGHTDAGEDVHVFAREVDGNGRRRFLVTSYGELFRRVSLAHRSGGGHYYEVIREGQPCYLYFDIEYAKAHNEGKDGDAALSTFVWYLPLAIRRLFPERSLELAACDIVDLESSTPKKFSRHLICKINGGRAMFRNNGHMGAFVVRLASMIAEDIAIGGDLGAKLEALYAMDAYGKQELFVDMGVYTKNRCFRTAFSCKHGKRGANLCPSSANESQYDAGEDEAFFYRSLVCRMPPAIGGDCIDFLSDPSLPRESSASCKAGRPGDGGWGGSSGGARSDWPKLDEYVLRAWNERGGTPGGRICKVLCPPGGTSAVLVYSLVYNRWCEGVGRHHRSNGVMLVVDVKRACFYQKCHDPDCRARAARSLDYPLPREVLPLKFGFGEGGQAAGEEGRGEEDDDALMVQALEEYERRCSASQHSQPATVGQGEKLGPAYPCSPSAAPLDKCSASRDDAGGPGAGGGSGPCSTTVRGGGGMVGARAGEEEEEWGDDEDALMVQALEEYERRCSAAQCSQPATVEGAEG